MSRVAYTIASLLAAGETVTRVSLPPCFAILGLLDLVACHILSRFVRLATLAGPAPLSGALHVERGDWHRKCAHVAFSRARFEFDYQALLSVHFPLS